LAPETSVQRSPPPLPRGIFTRQPPSGPRTKLSLTLPAGSPHERFFLSSPPPPFSLFQRKPFRCALSSPQNSFLEDCFLLRRAFPSSLYLLPVIRGTIPRGNRPNAPIQGLFLNEGSFSVASGRTPFSRFPCVLKVYWFSLHCPIA